MHNVLIYITENMCKQIMCHIVYIFINKFKINHRGKFEKLKSSKYTKCLDFLNLI